MTTYRLVAISDGIEHDAGTIDTLIMPPGAALVVRVPKDTVLYELDQIRRTLHKELPAMPIVVVRGDMQFLRLVPTPPTEDEIVHLRADVQAWTDAPNVFSVSTEGASWAMEGTG